MSRFLSAAFAALDPYTPGEQPRDRRYIKLNTNESPFPPAPGVMEAVGRALVERLNLYSDPTAKLLEDALADFYGVSPSQVIAGNGSDEILAFCFQAFCDDACPPCYPDITYGFYAALSQLYHMKPRIIPLEDDFSIAPEKYFGGRHTIFLANPNAPTGICLPLSRVEDILRNNPNHIVVVDEAYVDFGGESAVPLIPKYDNLVVVMTFSKSRSLAGGRVGFALGQPALIDDLRRIKFSFNPYNVGALSQAAGAAAVRDRAYFDACRKAIAETRDWTAAALRARGFTVTDSRANFLFVRPPNLPGKAYCARLRERGVLVRHFDKPRIADWARVSVGTREQMERFLEAGEA